MKILILSWRCIKNPASGGSEIYFHELAKRWVKLGNEVVWFSPEFPGCKREELCDGVKIIRRGGRLTVYLHAFWSYITELDRDFDAVIDVENGIPFFSPTYIRKGKIFLHVHHVHKDVWFEQERFPLSWIGYFLEMKMMPRIYKRNKVVTISDSSARDILTENITAKSPPIVNPGIVFCKYKKFGKNKVPAVLFMNRIKKYKGVKILLDAVRILAAQNQKIYFWICGSGDDLPEMKKYAHKNGLKNVQFFGRVSENKKVELMQRAWVFVNPSFKEGWGIVNIEANYFGTPVIGSDVSGIRDSVVDGKTGLLFKYGDSDDLAEKISLLIEDDKLRARISREASRWAKHFDWDVKAREYLNILSK